MKFSTALSGFRHIFIVINLLLAATAAYAADPPGTADGRQEYLQGEEFPGVVGKTLKESSAAWPVRKYVRSDAPNVLVWLLDDAGYGHLGPYGGLVDTPTIDKIASTGLVFSNFHSVPLCSPARAALLSGRNHHSVGMGSHIMSPAGFPGYNGQVPPSAGSLAAVLKQAGYSTYALGKWDQTPVTEAGPAGPYDSWPSGQGFDHFYGFLGGEASHFAPNIWQDHTPISPHTNDPDYFLTTDLADQAVSYLASLRSTRPGTPFFMYWSTGAVHAPHHAPKPYIEKYKGRFDNGWDSARVQILRNQIDAGLVPRETRLAPKPSLIRDWADLNDKEQALYARQMEAFAAQLTHADEQFGRIIDYLDAEGILDNTIIIISSDNGASGEGGMYGLHNEALSLNSQKRTFEDHYKFFEDWGGPSTTNHFHAGWGMAGNTPFPYFKHHADLGGTRVPLIVSWPSGLEERGIRDQYHHIIDVMPTVLKLASVQMPQVLNGVIQKPLDGVDMSYAMKNEKAKTARNRQYYEIWGNRAIYDNGWLAVTIHNEIMPWQVPVPADPENDLWRLYNLNSDFSASRNLAQELPQKLEEMKALWWEEAMRFGVLPLDPNRRARFIAAMNKSGPKGDVIRFPGFGAHRIPEALSPPVKRRSFDISVRLAEGGYTGERGVLVGSGGKTGGYTIYVQDQKLHFAYNFFNERIFRAVSKNQIDIGAKEFTVRFIKDEDSLAGNIELLIDGNNVGGVKLEDTIPNSFSIGDPFDIGMDSSSPVIADYRAPFEYTGGINEVVFYLGKL